MSEEFRVKWHPLSVEMVEGVQKQAIQPEMKAQATVSAVISGIVIASGQRVNQSTQVGRYVYPLEVGGVQQDRCGCGVRQYVNTPWSADTVDMQVQSDELLSGMDTGV